MSYQSNRTTDKYVKVRKQAEKAPENEVRIKAVPRIGRYISYAATLLLGEKKLDVITLKASGNAAKSACQIAEILRHRIVGLHQLNVLKTVSVTDEYEPKEEGLDRVVVERQLAVLEIQLSLKADAFNNKDVGYQAPLPKEQVQEEDLKNLLEGRKRGGEEGGDRPPRRNNRRGGRRGGYAGNRGGRRGGDRREDGDRRGGDDRRGGEDRRGGDDRRGGERRDNRDYRDNRGGDDRRGGERRDNRDNRGGDRGYDNRDRRDNRDNRDNNRGGDRGYDNRRDNRDNRDNNRGGERRTDSRQGGNRRD